MDHNVSGRFDILDSNILGLEEIFLGVKILLDTVHHWVMVMVLLSSSMEVLENHFDINVSVSSDIFNSNILSLKDIVGRVIVLLDVLEVYEGHCFYVFVNKL